LKDEYAGVMKGVILTINPNATIIDISHQISPYDIVQAAVMARSSLPYFPPETIHLVVVDPGVGSLRDILIVQFEERTCIAPDNGVLSLLLEKETPKRVVRATDPSYFLPHVSHTFHGRDIFAPIAAHLSLGVKLTRFGVQTDYSTLVRLNLQQPHITIDNTLVGTVLSVDRFGNLVTNIPFEMLKTYCPSKALDRLLITVGDFSFAGVSKTYADAADQQVLALIGSHGYLEIAVNRGSAHTVLEAQAGDRVKLSSATKVH
jgi:S-adenosylmethionine hydrolase